MSWRLKSISDTLADFNYDEILSNWIKMMITQDLVIDDDKYDALKIHIKQMLRNTRLLETSLDNKIEKETVRKIMIIIDDELLHFLIENYQVTWKDACLIKWVRQINSKKRDRAMSVKTEKSAHLIKQAQFSSISSFILSTMIDFDHMILTSNDMMNNKMIHHSQLFIANEKQSNLTLKNVNFNNYQRQLVSKTMFNFEKKKIIYEVEDFKKVEIRNAVNFHVALINMTKKRIFYYIFQVQAIEKHKRSEHENFMQCLNSAVESTDNFTSFKISSEDESEQLITKKRKLYREVHLNVSIVTFEVLNIVKTVNLNESLSLTTDSLTTNDDLNMREVMKYNQEHIDLSFVINFIDITQM